MSFDVHNWNQVFQKNINSFCSESDPAHDRLHLNRVVRNALQIAAAEGAKVQVVLPAAWLHDFVVVPKDSPLRSKASRLSADEAIKFLEGLRYPHEVFDEIHHAIEAHSFSANVPTRTPEAEVVQDADRLDGLGAIGISRCFATAGLMKRTFYSELDPFCKNRDADDSQFTIDHFYKKLFQTAETLKTQTGREKGRRRVEYMRQFLQELEGEISL